MSAEPGFFYEGGGRRAAIDALFEGIYRDDAVVLLVGPGGAGRTAVLDRFRMEVDPDVLAVGMATGDILMSAEQCFLALAASLGAPGQDADGGGSAPPDARAALFDALSGVRAAGRVPVIVVDDAHELGEDARDGIIAACREAAVPLVLAGDETLPALTGDLPGCVAVTLRAFTEDETEDFVAGWLAVGDEDELPSHRAMARLHRQSGGVPGLLVDLLESGATTRTALLPAGFPVWHLAFTLLAVALLLWLLARTDAEPVAAKVVQVEEIPVPLPAPGETAAAENKGVVPATNFAPVAVPVPARVDAVSPEEPVAGPAVSSPDIASSAAPAAAKEPPRTIRKFSVDEVALQKEKASRYTLQLFASRNEEAVRQFRARHAGLEIRSFRTSREDLPWYVAVTGSHRNKDEAKAAVAKLPADIQKLKPWPRSLRDIQDELRRRKD